jgi:hypothetical protein
MKHAFKINNLINKYNAKLAAFAWLSVTKFCLIVTSFTHYIKGLRFHFWVVSTFNILALMATTIVLIVINTAPAAGLNRIPWL